MHRQLVNGNPADRFYVRPGRGEEGGGGDDGGRRSAGAGVNGLRILAFLKMGVTPLPIVLNLGKFMKEIAGTGKPELPRPPRVAEYAASLGREPGCGRPSPLLPSPRPRRPPPHAEGTLRGAHAPQSSLLHRRGADITRGSRPPAQACRNRVN